MKIPHRLHIAPITLREANAFVCENHRHHGASRGCRFALACRQYDALVGVAICGRPIARLLDDGFTLEVLRVCTDGTKNACSFLYGGCRRVALAMGYRRVLTYTLKSESGISLRAAGWVRCAESQGGSWSRSSRPRTDPNPTEPKVRWEAPMETAS